MTALVIVASIAALGGTIDSTAVRAITARVAHFRQQAADVFAVVAIDRVDGAACSALADGRVRAAGALRKAAAVLPTAAPNNPIPVFDVTPGLLAALGVRTDAIRGVWASESVATQYSIAGSWILSTTLERVPISGTFAYPEDGRDPELGFSLLRLVPVARGVGALPAFDACWAQVWPYDEDAVGSLTAVVRGASASSDTTVEQLNTNAGRSYDPFAAFAQRPTRFAPSACLLVAAFVGFILVWLRRLELAAALHVGMRRRDLLAQTFIEVAVVAMPASISAVSVLVASAVRSTDGSSTDWSAASIGWISIVSTVIGYMLGAVVAACAVRETSYYAYFKSRS